MNSRDFQYGDLGATKSGFISVKHNQGYSDSVHKFNYNISNSNLVKEKYSYMNSDYHKSTIHLNKHEIFPGYTLAKPVQLQKQNDILTSLDNQILREQLRVALQLQKDTFQVRDLESLTQQKTCLSEDYEENPSRFTYLPNYHNKTYDYSKKTSFKMTSENASEEQAKNALRVLIDFLKEEIESKRNQEASMKYEPLMTHLILYQENHMPSVQELPELKSTHIQSALYHDDSMLLKTKNNNNSRMNLLAQPSSRKENKQNIQYLSQPSSPKDKLTQNQELQRNPFSYNYIRYIEDKKQSSQQLPLSKKFNSFRLNKPSISLNTSGLLQLAASELNETLLSNKIMNISSVEKNYLKSQQIIFALQSKINECDIEIEQYKDINKKLIEKLLESEKKIEMKPIQETTAKQEISKQRRNGQLIQQSLSYFMIAEQTCMVQQEIRQQMSYEIEEWMEMFSNLNRDFLNLKAKMTKRIQKLKTKQSHLLIYSNDLERLIGEEQKKNESLNKRLNEKVLQCNTMEKELLHYKKKSEEQRIMLEDLNYTIQRKQKDIQKYQVKYQDIDVDILHEKNQELQTKVFTLQQKIENLNQLCNTLKKQASHNIQRQNNLFEGEKIEVERQVSSLSQSDDSEFNAQRFLQDALEDYERLAVKDQNQDFEYEKKVLNRKLSKFGLNANFEVYAGSKKLNQIETQIL